MHTAYADKAIDIMNQWSATLTTLTGNAERFPNRTNGKTRAPLPSPKPSPPRVGEVNSCALRGRITKGGMGGELGFQVECPPCLRTLDQSQSNPSTIPYA
jgi:hypothetical protein